MTTKTFLSIASMIFSLAGLAQNDNTHLPNGSYMGTIGNKDFSTRILLRFENKNNQIKGFLDLPDKAIKDIGLDKVWIVNDSVFADARNSMGWPADAPITFKGRMSEGSIIDGTWGGNMPLKLTITDFVFSLKTNTKPIPENFKIVKLINSTPINDQNISGACWSYATTSFIETEAIRKGKKAIVLAPMFFVRSAYIDKAERYIRKNGNSFFSEGDLTFSALKAYKKFGAIPESVYSGKNSTDLRHDHTEMNAVLLDKVKFYAKSGRGIMTPEKYRNEVDSVLTVTMGKVPDNFMYEGKEYTPQSFAKDNIGINPDDYVEITSYSHHPFYSKFALEIEANWDNNKYLNLPINEFAAVVDNALLNNYSVSWDGDTYENFNDGFAEFTTPVAITQELRQAAFDNRTTEDVHNMHIIGIVENEKGKRYYVIKNSSDAKNCGGYMYMSREYLLLKTISVMVNKNALPIEIKNKLSRKELIVRS